MLSFRYLRIGNNHGEDGPIHEAALRGSLEEVRRLIMDSPFILNLKGADSRSPLTYAVWSGNVALVTYLVNRGASVFEKDEAGAVPLHHAAFHGFPEVVDYLVDKGTDVNVSDNDKCTPLFYAAYAGHLETVQMLLYLGSDSSVLNKEGKNAMDVACIGGNRKNREAILSALSAGYNLRRDREERQRLREELKNRLAIEAKDQAAQRKREEDARREAAARKRREQDERQRAEMEEKEAEVQWRLHEEKTKKFKDTQTKLGMDQSLRSNANTPGATSSTSAFFPIPQDQAPDTNSFYYQSQTPGATRMLVHHDSSSDNLANNGHAPLSGRASPHSHHQGPSPVPHHASDASLNPEAYRRPVTPYSDGPSRASPHGPPPQAYDAMPPVDAYGRPRYPAQWYEDPHHMAPRYASPPPPEMGPYGPPQRPPMWDYDYPRPTPRYYGPYDPAYGPPRYPSPSPYGYGPMPHPEEYRRPHTAPESARYSPYGAPYSPVYGPPGPYEHPPLSHRWAPPEEGEYMGRPSTARRSYDHPPYSARAQFREGGYPSSGRDLHRDRELEEVYARYEEEKRARERLEREKEEREVALAEQSRWRKEQIEDGGRREAHQHRVSSSAPPPPAKESAPSTPPTKPEPAPPVEPTPPPEEAAVPPARLGRKPTPPMEEETEKGGPITNLPIHVSSLSGNLGEVKRLITDRPGLVHKRGLYLRTPLLCAASRGHFEVLKFLVEEGAPIEVVDEIKWSALHHAAGNGYAAIIRYLVEQGLDVNARDKYEWTPLYRAAYNGHVEAVKTLLELGADRTLRDEKGKSPLQMACTGANKQNKEVIISILESEAPPRRVSTAAPVEVPVPAPIEAPVEAPVEAAPAIVAVLAETGSKNDAAEVEAAAKAEADNKAKTETAAAASTADAAKAKAEADAKAKAEEDAKALTAKVKAIEAAEAAPLAGPAKNQPVHSAAFKGKLEDVKRIVGENPLAANARGDLLRTPLMLASGAGHAEVAKYLLDEGAQLEAKDEWQGRALHMASLYGHDKVVDLLVERGADVNATAKHGCTALYYAAYNGHALAVKSLLANGAEKSLGDEKGKNPQAVACDGGNAANKTALLSLFTMPADKLKAK